MRDPMVYGDEDALEAEAAKEESSKSVSEQVADDVEEEMFLRSRVSVIEELGETYEKEFPWTV